MINVSKKNQRCCGCRRKLPLSEFRALGSRMQSHSKYCNDCSERAKEKRRDIHSLEYRRFVEEQERREQEAMRTHPKTVDAFARLRAHREAAGA